MAHTCKNCGAVADDPGHLCNPTVEAVSCSYCGNSDVVVTHVCKGKLEAMKFSCKNCGRVAAASGDLCSPEAIA